MLVGEKDVTMKDCLQNCPKITEDLRKERLVADFSANGLPMFINAVPSAALSRHCADTDKCAGPIEREQREVTLPFSKLRSKFGMNTTRRVVVFDCRREQA